MFEHLISLRSFALALLLTLSFIGEASAETAFIPVQFGATFEPQQINDLLMERGAQHPSMSVLSKSDRDGRLNLHFPELTLPNVADLEQLFSQGNEAFLDGDYEDSADALQQALEKASTRLSALSLRPGFAETTYQGGLYLAQVLSVLERGDDAEKVIEKLVRLFPTQRLEEGMVAPSFFEMYQSYLPTSSTGKALTVKVASGCHARVNGMDLPVQESVELQVLSGTYGVVEVCNEQTVRAYIVPVARDLVVDFHGPFAEAYTYPINLSLDATKVVEDSASLGGFLATIGERVGVTHVVGGGLVPEGGEAKPGYRLVLVEVSSQKITREFTVPPAELANAEKMDDALNVLWSGGEFQVIEPEPSGGISWSLIGYVSMGTGVAVLASAGVMGYLAKTANDDFFSCNDDPECRVGKDREDYVRDRARYSLVADVLYVTGAVVFVAGTGLLIYDLTSGPSVDETASSEPTWTIGVAPTTGGGVFGLNVLW